VRNPLLLLPLLHWSLFHRRLRLPLQMQISRSIVACDVNQCRT